VRHGEFQRRGRVRRQADAAVRHAERREDPLAGQIGQRPARDVLQDLLQQ
jgi:hypothetical protein